MILKKIHFGAQVRRNRQFKGAFHKNPWKLKLKCVHPRVYIYTVHAFWIVLILKTEIYYLLCKKITLPPTGCSPADEVMFSPVNYIQSNAWKWMETFFFFFTEFFTSVKYVTQLQYGNTYRVTKSVQNPKATCDLNSHVCVCMKQETQNVSCKMSENELQSEVGLCIRGQN